MNLVRDLVKGSRYTFVSSCDGEITRKRGVYLRTEEDDEVTFLVVKTREGVTSFDGDTTFVTE